jgi:hypothetical protein
MVRCISHDKETGSPVEMCLPVGVYSFEAAMRLVDEVLKYYRPWAGFVDRPMDIDFETFRRERNEEDIRQFRIAPGQSLDDFNP